MDSTSVQSYLLQRVQAFLQRRLKEAKSCLQKSGVNILPKIWNFLGRHWAKSTVIVVWIG